MNNEFNVNQIVKGSAAGVFVILGFRTINDKPYAQVKPVNPEDHTQVGTGEFSLPLTCLKPLE